MIAKNIDRKFIRQATNNSIRINASEKQTLSFKQFNDYFIALLLLVLFSPIMIIISAAIKLTSPGPIFYRQERVGKGGINYQIIKFRSMKVGAEKNSGPIWAKENDKRISPIGNFLRKSHFDELPQIFNV